MQLEFLKKPKSGASVVIHQPRGFSDGEFGAIAFELNKTYVLYCETHRKIKGETQVREAERQAYNSHRWCTGCRDILVALKAAVTAEQERYFEEKQAIEDERFMRHKKAWDAKQRRKRMGTIPQGLLKRARAKEIREEREKIYERVAAKRLLKIKLDLGLEDDDVSSQAYEFLKKMAAKEKEI